MQRAVAIVITKVEALHCEECLCEKCSGDGRYWRRDWNWNRKEVTAGFGFIYFDMTLM
jgi:hypothetical protein